MGSTAFAWGRTGKHARPGSKPQLQHEVRRIPSRPNARLDWPFAGWFDNSGEADTHKEKNGRLFSLPGRSIAIFLEHVPCADLHHARLALNLSKVRPIRRRAQFVQTGIQGDSEVSDASQLLGIGYVEHVPSDLQLMVLVVRHLPGF